MTGCSLDAFEKLPRALLKHLGKHLSIVTPDLSSLRDLYRRRRSSARQTRPLLRTILKLPLQYEVTEPVGKAVALMRKLYESNAPTLPADAGISFAPGWADVLGGKDRRQGHQLSRALPLSDQDLRESHLSGLICGGNLGRWHLGIRKSLQPIGMTQQWAFWGRQVREFTGIAFRHF